MNSLNHLLLPDHLSLYVTVQMFNHLSVFLALLNPNQRVKTIFPLRLPWRKVSVLFIILAARGVKAEAGGSPLRLAVSCPRSGELNLREPGTGELALVQRFSQFYLGQS